MDSADAQLPSEAPLRHRARHRHALCATQREPDAGVHQVLPRACVQVGDYVAHHHGRLCATGHRHGEDGDRHRAHRTGDLRRDAEVQRDLFVGQRN